MAGLYKGKKFQVRIPWNSHAPGVMVVRITSEHYGELNGVCYGTVEQVTLDTQTIQLPPLSWPVMLFFIVFLQWHRLSRTRTVIPDYTGLQRVQPGESYPFDPMMLTHQVA